MKRSGAEIVDVVFENEVVNMNLLRNILKFFLFLFVFLC